MMPRYTRQTDDEAIIAAGWPSWDPKTMDGPEARRLLADAQANFLRCSRRLRMSTILEDVDTVGGPDLGLTAGAALLIAFAIDQIELEIP